MTTRMPITFSAYILQISEALDAQDGPRLAYLLRPTSSHVKDLLKEFRNPTYESLAYYQDMIENPWGEIAIRYMLIANHIAKRRSADAFKEHTVFVGLFLRVFGTTTGWTLPALFAILRDLRDIAFDADNETQEIKCMEEAARICNKAFSICLTDRSSPYAESRKWGTYYVVGLVLKCYFRVKRISLSKNILRAIDANPDLPPLEQFPKAHQVTYKYYIGMLSFLNEDFAKSEQELTFSFYHCHVDAHSNRERILTYLIPLRILRGHLPSRELLDRFSVLDELYSPFVSAVRTGDIRAFDAALERWERRLLELNVWLAVEKARELCIRGLFRRVWVASRKSNRIPISMFHAALNISGMDMPLEEAECLLANQIYRGFIKGYISHEKQMVVLSNVNAFPRLTDPLRIILDVMETPPAKIHPSLLKDGLRLYVELFHQPRSQSSRLNAHIPNVGATSPLPPDRLSTPLLTNLTSPSSSRDILSTLLKKSSSPNDVFRDAVYENDGSGGGTLASSSESVSLLSDISRSSRSVAENPTRSRRWRFRRLLRWRFMRSSD